MTDWITARNRSYDVCRDIPVGAYVTVTTAMTRGVPRTPGVHADGYDRYTLNPGDVFRVENYSNAGDRGIEVALRAADGTYLPGISAGLIETASRPATREHVVEQVRRITVTLPANLTDDQIAAAVQDAVAYEHAGVTVEVVSETLLIDTTKES